MRVFLVTTTTTIALSSLLLFLGFYSSNLAYGQQQEEAPIPECPEYLEEFHDGKLVKLPTDCNSYAENYYFKPLYGYKGEELEGIEEEGEEETMRLNVIIVLENGTAAALFE